VILNLSPCNRSLPRTVNQQQQLFADRRLVLDQVFKTAQHPGDMAFFVSKLSTLAVLSLLLGFSGSSHASRVLLQSLFDNLGIQIPQDTVQRVQQAQQLQQEYVGSGQLQEATSVPQQQQQSLFVTQPQFQVQQPYQQQQSYNQQPEAEPFQAQQQPAGGTGQYAEKLAGSDPLELHNAYRSYHGSQSLTWDDSLRASAKQWCDHLASSCKFYHSGPGENLASGFTNWADVMWAFYVEYKSYNFNAPGYSPATGHFTQLLWRDTQRVGCDSSNSGCQGMIFCCHYDPVGNVNAPQYFQQNVYPPTSSATV